jgi:NAD(P)-dependent dehydrogenase (short-subunit alcohol dehydrogenase family)
VSSADQARPGRLPGQTAIVTGGGQGIGGATARRLAEEGASVLVVDLDRRVGEQNVETIRATGGTAEFFQADVGEHEPVRAMVERALARWGRLDILVNNAYQPPERGGAVEVSEQAWDRGMAVLVKALFLATKYAVPAMERGGGGSIVNLASVHGLLGAPGHLTYETGKAAVIGLTRQLATQYGPSGIRVNAICPGHILTERQIERWDQNPSGLRFFEQQYPLRRCGRPVDIANAAVFLCSDEASFITGHTMVVDGGLTVQLQENLGVHLAHYIQEHPETRLPY